MAVRDAYGADVVPLGEKQLENHAAIFAQALAIGLDVHAFGDLGRAGGQQLRDAGYLDDAQTACADVIDAFKVAQGRDHDARLGCRL